MGLLPDEDELRRARNAVESNQAAVDARLNELAEEGFRRLQELATEYVAKAKAVGCPPNHFWTQRVAEHTWTGRYKGEKRLEVPCWEMHRDDHYSIHTTELGVLIAEDGWDEARQEKLTAKSFRHQVMKTPGRGQWGPSTVDSAIAARDTHYRECVNHITNKLKASS